MKYLLIAIIAVFVAGCAEITPEQKAQIKDAVTEAVKDQLNK